MKKSTNYEKYDIRFYCHINMLSKINSKAFGS